MYRPDAMTIDEVIAYITEKIHTGQWRAGDPVPSNSVIGITCKCGSNKVAEAKQRLIEIGTLNRPSKNHRAVVS